MKTGKREKCNPNVLADRCCSHIWVCRCEWMRMCFSSGAMHKYHCRCSVMQVLSLSVSLALSLPLLYTHTHINREGQDEHKLFSSSMTHPFDISPWKKKKKKQNAKAITVLAGLHQSCKYIFYGTRWRILPYLSSFQRWVENTGGGECMCVTVKIRQIP